MTLIQKNLHIWWRKWIQKKMKIDSFIWISNIKLKNWKGKIFLFSIFIIDIVYIKKYIFFLLNLTSDFWSKNVLLATKTSLCNSGLYILHKISQVKSWYWTSSKNINALKLLEKFFWLIQKMTKYDTEIWRVTFSF